MCGVALSKGVVRRVTSGRIEPSQIGDRYPRLPGASYPATLGFKTWSSRRVFRKNCTRRDLLPGYSVEHEGEAFQTFHSGDR
jgi:hypothetical protein